MKMKEKKQLKEIKWYENKKHEDDNRDEKIDKLLNKQKRNDNNVKVGI